MRNKRKLMSYYKKKYYKGRTAFARAVDFIALRIIAAAAGYLWFTGLMNNTVMSVILSVTATLAVSVAAELYKSIRLDKFILTERDGISMRLFRERLALMPDEAFKELVRGYVTSMRSALPAEPFVCAKRSMTPVDEDAVLSVYRSAKKRGYADALIFTASNVTDKALELAEHCNDVCFAFITPHELAENKKSAALMPTEGEVDSYIIALVDEQKRKRRLKTADPLNSNRTKRYLIVSIALFAASFFVDYPLYYRLMSAACLSFGTAAWWLSTMERSGKGTLDNT